MPPPPPGHTPLPLSQEPARIVHLDYLRGLAALSVMLFHFDKWSTTSWDANTFLGKCGVYAVSVFFVLSGLTLSIVYAGKLGAAPGAWLAFWRARFFRIFPLLWLATLATLLLEESPYPMGHILLNVSGLFGFVSAADDIALGAWSIGDELVYYAAFPLLWWLASIWRPVFFLLFACSACLLGVYAFSWTHTGATVTDQWPVYVQAPNHAFFFLGGMAIALLREGWSDVAPGVWKKIIALGLLCFWWYGPGEDPAYLISGIHRVLLSGLVLALTAAWLMARPQLPAGPDRVFRWLGEISYSLYLLHPLVYRCLKALDARFLGGTQTGLVWVAVFATLVLSHISYRMLEKPVMDWARRRG